MTDPRRAAALLGGTFVSPNKVLFPGPGHSAKDRSAQVTFGAGPDGFLCHSHAGDDPLALRDHVRLTLGLGQFRPGIQPRPAPAPVRAVANNDDARRTTRALAIWQQAVPLPGTPGEAYLRRERGVELPPAGADVLRWHPACPFAGARHGALVALVTGIGSNVPRAIHRTLVRQDGTKGEVQGRSRAALGPLAGGAVKLWPDDAVSLALAVAEGIETALSLARLPECHGVPAWSLISAAGVVGLPVLSGITALHIAVDNDASGAGDRAARQCAMRWHEAGREVWLHRPTAVGLDMNDITREARRHG